METFGNSWNFFQPNLWQPCIFLNAQRKSAQLLQTFDYTKTMPLWPRGTESYMQSKIENKLLTPEERKKVKEDLLFF